MLRAPWAVAQNTEGTMTEQYHTRITQATSNSGATWDSIFSVTCAIGGLLDFLTRRMRSILLKSTE